MDRRQMLLNSN